MAAQPFQEAREAHDSALPFVEIGVTWYRCCLSNSNRGMQVQAHGCSNTACRVRTSFGVSTSTGSAVSGSMGTSVFLWVECHQSK
jgi:hypothetical protein